MKQNLPEQLTKNVKVPVIAAPMYIVSSLDLVVEQCKAGIIGSFPALNARKPGEFEQWLVKINEALKIHDSENPNNPAASYAVNLIVNPKSNRRLEEDLELCVKYKVPIVLTSLGAMAEVNKTVQSYGGIVLHDVINEMFAKKAISKGADGLVAVAAGAGGHAGSLSPFALVQEIRSWFDGPLALSGCIATGDSILGAQAMGADFAYIGSPFIATKEANCIDGYKQMVVESNSSDIVYTDYFSGINGNYLIPSIRRSGLDPFNLPLKNQDAKGKLKGDAQGGGKAWRDIWGAGQGIGVVDTIIDTKDLVGRFVDEYENAKLRLASI